MFNNFDFEVLQRTWWNLITEGLLFTIELTVLAMVGGIILGTLMAMMRLSSNRFVSLAASGYVNLVRSVPLLLVIFWFYFLVPYIGAWIIGSPEPVKVGPLMSCMITFVMFEAAYYCEIMRSGIQSIPRGQVWAGNAMGMNYFQTMRHIVLPQAFRNMLPVLLTQTIVLYQDVSLVSVLSIKDFVGSATVVANNNGRPVEINLFVGVVYFVTCFALSTLVKKLNQKIAIIR
ncbi:amino acid ABC transporter permease [Undibacterium sp. Ji50W]|uniref:amino acid ABC transporter permease n=1 Tax=Undibacterium sp. Ji50W TaxID=3413041 RepID=UPI003BF12F31